MLTSKKTTHNEFFDGAEIIRDDIELKKLREIKKMDKPLFLKKLSSIVGYEKMELLTFDYQCDIDRNHTKKCALSASYKFQNDTIFRFHRSSYEESKDLMIHALVEDVEMTMSQLR